MTRILHRYILREIMVPFVFGLTVFTFVLLIARLLKLVELVVNRGVPTPSILRVFFYIIPAFLELTVPMATLLAVLVAFGRLSADSEIVALRSSGLSLYQLVLPVAVFVALTTTATLALAVQARPWGNRSLRSALFDIARTRASAGIRPKVFNDDFPELVIYAEEIDPRSDRLRHVLVSDERSPDEQSRIFAREGLMLSDAEAETVTLRLRDGFIHTVDTRGGAEYQTDFDSYDVSLDLRQLLAGAAETYDPKEMTLAGLARVIKIKRERGRPVGPELVEYHRKFSIPFACVVFALLAVPLGIQPVRAARSRGFGMSIVIIFGYYVLLSGGEALAKHGLVPAVVGLWLPNLAFAALGTYLFVLAARERTLLEPGRLESLLGALRARLGAKAAS